MTWLDILQIDRPMLGFAVCSLLLAGGLMRTFALCHGVQAAQVDLEARAAAQALHLEEFQQRLDGVEHFRTAQEADARSRHDGDVVELLGSLLEFNESLRRPFAPLAGDQHPSQRSGEAP